MRDPAGQIVFERGFVVRHLNQAANSQHFLHSALAQRWVKQGLLIAYEWVDAKTIRSPLLPFLTLPSEWTDKQFFVAAQLTLQLQTEAVAEGWDLKDASAWNVVFNGLQPVFVDLLSFEPLRHKLWRAAGQFSRHFLIPLLLGKKGLMEPRQCIQLWRDGVPPNSARELLGVGRFFTRYWPLMTGGGSYDAPLDVHTASIATTDLALAKEFREGLHRTFQWMLNGINPICKKERSTLWGEYEQERNHYGKPALAYKRQIINKWLQSLQPTWVLDLGCNAGEFSEMAIAVGAKVICWDSDAQALATLFMRYSQTQSETHFFPILCSIDDATGGRGWMGNEFSSLRDRLHQRCDVVMLLAITHHLAIAGGVRLDDIFRFAAHISRRAVFLELLSEKDIRVIELCQRFNRDPSEFTIQKQLAAAAAAGFIRLEHAKRSCADTREYVWLEHSPLS